MTDQELSALGALLFRLRKRAATVEEHAEITGFIAIIERHRHPEPVEAVFVPAVWGCWYFGGTRTYRPRRHLSGLRIAQLAFKTPGRVLPHSTSYGSTRMALSRVAGWLEQIGQRELASAVRQIKVDAVGILYQASDRIVIKA
jgi:hypothetical protein